MRDDVARARGGLGHAAATSSGSGSGSRTGSRPPAGSAFEGRYDYAAIGNAVIIASRLSGQAAAGQVLLSQRLLRRRGGRVEAEAVDGLQLKGVSHPVTAWSVHRPARRRLTP